MVNRDPFENFDSKFNSIFRFGAVLAILSVIASLALTGAIIWAIIYVVTAVV